MWFKYMTTYLTKLGSINHQWRNGHVSMGGWEMVKRKYFWENKHSFTSSVFRKSFITSFDFLGTMEGSKCTSRYGSEFRKVVIHWATSSPQSLPWISSPKSLKSHKMHQQVSWKAKGSRMFIVQRQTTCFNTSSKIQWTNHLDYNEVEVGFWIWHKGHSQRATSLWPPCFES